MIRTVIVDDDFMAVTVHRAFTEAVPGFEVVGEARTGRAAIAVVGDLRPDLVLLDMYLPDLSGIEVLRRLRATPATTTDVIAITSAKDVAILRDAMHLGVVHYIVKPFSMRTLRERLETYATARARLLSMGAPEQRDIDRLWGLLRTSGDASLPKGISAPTLALVARVLRCSEDGVPAAELADRTGVSLGVARRYLRFLAESGVVEVTVRYGGAGRPEHLHRWVGEPVSD